MRAYILSHLAVIFVAVCSLSFTHVAMGGIDDGLVAYWPMQELGYDILFDGPREYFRLGVRDYAGEHHGREETNNDSFSDHVWEVIGHLETAIELDDELYSFGVETAEELRPASDFSISAWVKPETVSKRMMILAYADDGNGDDGYSLSINAGGTVSFSAKNSHPIANQTVVSSNAIGSGVWSFVAGTYDGETLRIYVNGVETVNAAASGNVYYALVDNGEVRIGRRAGTFETNLYYSGVLDEIRFYNRTLTASDVHTLYTLVDNCPSNVNPRQEDRDGDGMGDACDPWPDDPENDIDDDGISGEIDTCPYVFNPLQKDNDLDGIGDVCDEDDDNDGVDDEVDNCPSIYNPDQLDLNGNGIGDVCDGIIHVDDDGPADYHTIQEAIDSATDGNTIIVEEGRYVEHVDLLDKQIILRSSEPENKAVMLNTIIDGGGDGCVIACMGGQGANTVVSGFYITNGFNEFGGGMAMSYSSPTISYCSFVANTSNFGGGIGMNYGMSKIRDCSFVANVARDLSGDEPLGGGIYSTTGSLDVADCVFVGNEAERGGGIFYEDPSLSVVLSLRNCHFSGNMASYGGAVGFCSEGNISIDGCAFRGNRAAESGGAVYYPATNVGDDVHDSDFCGNSPDDIDGEFIDGGGNRFGDCGMLSSSVKGDVDHDGDVDLDDLAVLAGNWLAGT